MSSTYSVFIPRVFSNIRANRISDTFHNLDIGDVEKVDLVAKTSKNGDSYNMAFVHFKGFFDTQAAADFRREVEDPEIKAKLVYEDPWFWLVLPFEKKEKPIDRRLILLMYSLSSSLSSSLSTSLNNRWSNSM